MNPPIPIEPLDLIDSLVDSIIKEIADRNKEKRKHHEEDFQILIIIKIKDDIKNRHTKQPAVKLSMESFGTYSPRTNFYHGWQIN